MRKTANHITSWCLAILVGMLTSSGIQAQTESASTWPYQDETESQRDARMGWWREARFGMFIHWGVYSVPAGTYDGKQIPGIGEWIMNRGKIPVERYQAYAREFNPVKYDPDQWVSLAKEAGMKYMVITAKHHDGFALFDSSVTDWDVVDATPYGKDLLKPLAEACKRHGLKLGFYYSQAQDWHHPGGAASGGHWDPLQDGSMDDYIHKIAVPQVVEILTRYGDLAVLWWDTPTNMNKTRADWLQPLIALQPGILTNNRLGGGYPGDFQTPEQYIPATGLDYDWETCMTMNGTWGFKSYDHNWKPTEVLVRNLVDAASKGGNYLLNVGPTSLGEIPGSSIERLKQVGQWMKVNGESVYGTTASPFDKLTWGRCTKKLTAAGTRLYLHVFDWPETGSLLVPGLKNRVTRASLLASGATVTTQPVEDGIQVQLPGAALDAIDTVVVLDIQGTPNIEKVLPQQSDDGTMTLSVTLADIHNPRGANAQVESKYGKPNIGYWLNENSWVDWTFKITQPGQFKITAQIACTGMAKAAIDLGKTRIDVTIQSTGDYSQYKPVDLGECTLDRPGTYTLSIKPVKGQWSPINLQDMVLSPK